MPSYSTSSALTAITTSATNYCSEYPSVFHPSTMHSVYGRRMERMLQTPHIAARLADEQLPPQLGEMLSHYYAIHNLSRRTDVIRESLRQTLDHLTDLDADNERIMGQILEDALDQGLERYIEETPLSTRQLRRRRHQRQQMRRIHQRSYVIESETIERNAYWEWHQQENVENYHAWNRPCTPPQPNHPRHGSPAPYPSLNPVSPIPSLQYPILPSPSLSSFVTSSPPYNPISPPIMVDDLIDEDIDLGIDVTWGHPNAWPPTPFDPSWDDHCHHS